MAAITKRCIHLYELPDVARPGPCGRYAGGWPTIHYHRLEAQEIPRRTPRLRSAAVSAHVAEATFSLSCTRPLCRRLDFNHSHILAPASSSDGVRLTHPLGMCLHSIIITFTPASVALFD